ncbi:MAG: hypothetical protein NC238_15980 [Dehalobacter sp.]|nr:hypothetical protein [Dehalobacter sp.]
MQSSDIGLAIAATSAASLIITISKFGLDSGIVRYIPTAEKRNILYSFVTVIVLMFSLICATVFLFIIYFTSDDLQFLLGQWISIFYILYIIVSVIYSIQNITLIALRKPYLSFLQNISLIIRVPLLLVFSSLGVLGIFIIYDVTFLLSVIVGKYLLKSIDIHYCNDIKLQEKNDIIKYSLGTFTYSILDILPTSIVPLIIISLAGASESAYFYIAYSIYVPLFMISSSISMSLFVEGSHEVPIKKNAKKAIVFSLLLLIPAIIVIYLFGDTILLIFNKEFSEQSFTILKILAISSLFELPIYIYLSINKIIKNVKQINLIKGVSCLLIVSLSLILINIFGVIGVAIAWLISEVFLGICVTIVLIWKNMI